MFWIKGAGLEKTSFLKVVGIFIKVKERKKIGGHCSALFFIFSVLNNHTLSVFWFALVDWCNSNSFGQDPIIVFKGWHSLEELAQCTFSRVDMVVMIHNDLLTHWRHIPMGQFLANIFLIPITSNYFWASEFFKNQSQLFSFSQKKIPQIGIMD